MENVIVTTVPELEKIIYSSVQRAMRDRKDPQFIEDKEFLNISEASEFLNLAAQTIYGLTCKREVPFFKRGKKLYFRKSDLISWLEKGRKKSQDELKSETDGSIFKQKGGPDE